MPDSLDKYQETFFRRLFGKSSAERIEELERENRDLREEVQFLQTEKNTVLETQLAYSMFVRLCLASGKELEPIDNLVLRQDNSDPNTALFEMVERRPGTAYRSESEVVHEKTASLNQVIRNMARELKNVLSVSGTPVRDGGERQ